MPNAAPINSEDLAHTNNSQPASLSITELHCVRALMPFYIVMRHTWEQRPISLSEFDHFIMSFEEVISHCFKLPEMAFDHYLNGGKGCSTEEIKALISECATDEDVIKALHEILTRRNRQLMMIFINVLNTPVLLNIIENVERPLDETTS